MATSFLCCKCICVNSIYRSSNTHPYRQVCKDLYNTTLVGERRPLKHRQILHQTIMDDVFHNLIYEVDLSAVQRDVIQVLRERLFYSTSVKTYENSTIVTNQTY